MIFTNTGAPRTNRNIVGMDMVVQMKMKSGQQTTFDLPWKYEDQIMSTIEFIEKYGKDQGDNKIDSIDRVMYLNRPITFHLQGESSVSKILHFERKIPSIGEVDTAKLKVTINIRTENGTKSVSKAYRYVDTDFAAEKFNWYYEDDDK
jgi:hypothetical protein